MVRPDLHLPQAFVAWMAPFLAAFCQRSRDTAAALAVGALLAIGPRTVSNCLRALGLADHPGFTAFHRVLNRNVWSGFALARTLLRQLVPVFEPGRPFVIIGVDHTLERRRGRRIEPASYFHDAVRSTGKNRTCLRTFLSLQNMIQTMNIWYWRGTAMARNKVQFQKGLSEGGVDALYGNEEKYCAGGIASRWPEGFECPACGGGGGLGGKGPRRVPMQSLRPADPPH